MNKFLAKSLILLSFTIIVISTVTLASDSEDMNEILARRNARIKAHVDRVISELRDQYPEDQKAKRRELEEELRGLFYKLIVKCRKEYDFDIDDFTTRLKAAQDHENRLRLVVKEGLSIIPPIGFEFKSNKEPDNPPGMNED